jgi:hypothetical protein
VTPVEFVLVLVVLALMAALAVAVIIALNRSAVGSVSRMAAKPPTPRSWSTITAANRSCSNCGVCRQNTSAVSTWE